LTSRASKDTDFIKEKNTKNTKKGEFVDEFGCSKCRWRPKGCGVCRDPNIVKKNKKSETMKNKKNNTIVKKKNVEPKRILAQEPAYSSSSASNNSSYGSEVPKGKVRHCEEQSNTEPPPPFPLFTPLSD
jgi:hypothetical protein